MKKSKFKTLKTFDIIEDDRVLEVDECFLTGGEIIKQKDAKDVGDLVTYYRVTKANGKNISYTMIYEKLEEG